MKFKTVLTIVLVLLCAVNVFAASKDEVVYVFADGNGKVDKVIVSDWLKNEEYAQTINDISVLTDIENLKGDELFIQKEKNQLIWNAAGNDIYYQGISKAELPVDLIITYTLDGKRVSASDMAGKSGKLVMRFAFENKSYANMETSDGQPLKIRVPFIAATGMLLDNDVFRNVNVDNARLINDGDRMVVVSALFPGWQENFAIDAKDYEIPTYFEISADVKDFKMGMTVSVVTNEYLNSIDFSDLKNGEELDGIVGKLMTSADELVNGVGQMLEGANQLFDGAVQISDGVGQLSDGLDLLTENSSALTDGAAQITDALMGEINKQLAAKKQLKIKTLTFDNYEEELDKVIKRLEKFKLPPKSVREGLVQLKDLKQQIAGLKTFREGLSAYTDGVAAVADGTHVLKSSLPDFTAGLGQLRDGIKLMFEEIKGAGIDVFKDGMSSFYERFKACIKVSQGYFNYSGLAEGYDGSVNYIIRTASV